MSPAFLQLFLLLNAVLIGVIGTIAWRHAMAHFRPSKHDNEHRATLPQMKLPPAVREQMVEQAQTRYEKIIEAAANELQLDLSKTKNLVNNELATLGSAIIDDEMKQYRASIAELQQQAADELTKAHEAITRHSGELQAAMVEQQKVLVAKMNEEVAAEKARIIGLIDTKLADATVSFLLDTMQNDVDLGAQVPYLTKMIEAHKEDFKKEVGDDPAK